MTGGDEWRPATTLILERDGFLDCDGFAVFAPHAAQTPADFAHRGISLDAGQNARQKVLGSARASFERRESGFDGLRVAALAKRTQALDLCLLD